MGRLEDAVDTRKQQLISKLLKHHIYKKMANSFMS